MTKFITEKRKANVGERILITRAKNTFGHYRNGMEMSVYERDATGVRCHSKSPYGYSYIFDYEYEVIVEAKPSKSERISLLESQVAELQAKVEALQKRRKPASFLTQAPTIHNVTVNLGESTAKTAEQLSEVFRKFSEEYGGNKPTPNEQRKAVIERAKAFVAKHTEKSGKAFISEGVSFGRYVCDVQFIVNIEKRVVTLLAKGVNSGKVHAKAIAKCAPDDVFNADIGKAIALGRALGLDVGEFENAVKPTEVVVGMRVLRTGDFKSTRGLRTIVSKVDGGAAFRTKEGDGLTYAEYIVNITDDTEAQY